MVASRPSARPIYVIGGWTIGRMGARSVRIRRPVRGAVQVVAAGRVVEMRSKILRRGGHYRLAPDLAQRRRIAADSRAHQGAGSNDDRLLADARLLSVGCLRVKDEEGTSGDQRGQDEARIEIEAR